jgi:hypothetical protein
MVQSIVLTQQISQTVNMVTDVRKEITDVRSLVREFFDRTRIENIQASDTNRLFFYEKADGAQIIGVRLENCPMEKSISGTARSDALGQIPLIASSMMPVSNFIFIKWSHASRCTNFSYTISYVINPDKTNHYESAAVKGQILYLDNRPIMHFE